jgi:hypothetical protein
MNLNDLKGILLTTSFHSSFVLSFVCFVVVMNVVFVFVVVVAAAAAVAFLCPISSLFSHFSFLNHS